MAVNLYYIYSIISNSIQVFHTTMSQEFLQFNSAKNVIIQRTAREQNTWLYYIKDDKTVCILKRYEWHKWKQI